MMHVLTVVGARPQFVKAGVVSRAILRAAGSGSAIEEILVHTGQHYDHGMSQVFFDELDIPEPRFNLGVGSGTHGAQTARMLEGLESVILETSPDVILAYGDTNSTLAAALAAAKIHVPIAHVEAGLRSFNRKMPEEINRIVADHVSDLLFAPTPHAVANLEREGLGPLTRLVGDVMADGVLSCLDQFCESEVLREIRNQHGETFGIATIHRPVNTDDPEALRTILDTLDQAQIPFVLPLHPRTRAAISHMSDPFEETGRLRFIDPVPYRDMLALVSAAAVVVTDSGGLQKECFLLGAPTVTLREETEWLETIDAGVNRLVSGDRDALVAALATAIREGRDPAAPARARKIYGDGQAADRIVTELLERYG